MANVRSFPTSRRRSARFVRVRRRVLVELKSGIGASIVPSKVYGILADGRPYIDATDPARSRRQTPPRVAGCGLVAACRAQSAALASDFAKRYDDARGPRDGHAGAAIARQ